MFENIRKCLEEFEETINKANPSTKEDKDIICYFDLHLAKALIKDWDAEKVAKIILAAKGLSNEVKVKVE